MWSLRGCEHVGPGSEEAFDISAQWSWHSQNLNGGVVSALAHSGVYPVGKSALAMGRMTTGQDSCEVVGA